MSIAPNTLLSLPTEILHRIFDDLDAETILLSVRHTCKQLQWAANAYNRLKLNWISKQKLTNLCQVLAPENVFSLRVQYDQKSSVSNNLDFFNNYIQRFTHLRSLTLPTFTDVELDILLNYLPNSRITELTIDMNTEQNYSKIESIKYCPLQRLSLNHCTYEGFSWIMRHCPDLQMLNVSFEDRYKDDEKLRNFFISMPYLSLKNLILDCSFIDTDELEILLLCMPSILRLELKGTGTSLDYWFDGSFLQKLITDKLTQLKHLKYQFFTILNPDNHDDNELETVISSFRTRFWCEEKRWFFSCTLNKRFPNIYINLESPPTKLICLNECGDESCFSLSNLPVTDHGRVIIKTMRSVSIDLDAMVMAASSTKANYANYYYMSHPIFLSLNVGIEWKQGWLQSLSSLMELRYLEVLALKIIGKKQVVSDSLLANITILLDRASNVYNFRINSNSLCINEICSIVPRRIKNLMIWVKTYEDMKTVLKQLNYLSTVTFKYEDYNRPYDAFSQIIQWLIQEKKTFTHNKDEYSLKIYLQQDNKFL